MFFSVVPMTEEHILEVARIEEESFSVPWSKNAFLESIKLEHSIFLTALYDGEIVGYIGMYKVFNDVDITNIAVSKEYRKKGVAKALMTEAFKRVKELGASGVMLEVRKTNLFAINLYEKFGFINIGIRKNFYEKPVEDAIIMWKKDL
jgi:ribosomal-protein-alanine N-acetyltransferase